MDRELLTGRAALSAPSRPILEANLWWRTKALPLHALIDSGADESFIDQGIVRQLGIETMPLTIPIDAKGLNGSLIARVTHKTVPLSLLLSGNHRESLCLHVMDCPFTPLVLGSSLATDP